MAKTNKKWTQLFGIILLLAIVGLFYYFGTSSSKIQNKEAGQTVSPQVSETKPQLSGRLVYAVVGTAGSDIYALNLADKKASIVFTDKDEKLKIKSASGVTQDGKFLALLAPSTQDFSGSLYLISIDGKATKEKLIDDFASPQPAVISPDGEKIAYIIFNNAEKDFGFQLNVMEKEGINKRLLAKEATLISNITWSKDAKAVYFSKNKPTGDEIFKADVNDLSSTKLATFANETVNALEALDDKLAVAKGPSGLDKANQAEVALVDLSGRIEKKLTQNEKQESYLKFKDGLLAFIATHFPDSKKKPGIDGEINILDLKSEELAPFSLASYLIGWSR